MAKRRTADQSVPEPELRVNPSAAAEKIDQRIALGKDLLSREIQTMEQLDAAKKEYYKWDAYNTELLRTLFTTPKFADEYSWWVGFVVGGGEESGQEQLDKLREDVSDKIHRLESIHNRLELMPVSAGVQKTPVKVERPHTNRVFVVHGHDEAAREAVARFLERLGIQAIVLHEQASGGRTIVEKLEHYGDVDFAVILLTPDDVGGLRTASDTLQPRARQNVVLELGYFVGKLGRNKVCTLYKSDVELPSDYLGVVYVPMDAAGAWRVQLAKELRAAEFSVDMNLVI
jgi:predicted nucleotide-binding protein